MADRSYGSIPRAVAAAAALAAVYFLAGKLGLLYASVHPSATPVWPPTGIAIAALLLLGLRFWPAIFLGAFALNITTAGTVATSIGIATGNTLEGVLGAWLVERYAGGLRVFNRPRDIFRFVVLTALLSTMVSPSFGVTSLAVSGVAGWQDYLPIWFTWWLGDVGGALIVAPLIILWGADPKPRWSRRQLVEAVALLVSLLLMGQVVFCGLVPRLANYPLSFACMPFLVWAAFRFGPRETAAATFIVSLHAVWGTLSGLGLFPRESPQDSLLLLQAFMGSMPILALPLAAVVAEGRRAQEALARRAAELARSNAELEQFAYVASHDLQEPLRTVTSFVQLLARRWRGRLDADADDFIGYAVEGAARMKQLIDDLLAFSRLHATAMPLQPTDCHSVLESVLAGLSHLTQENGAVITRGDMPTLMAAGSQLEQIFENLISNAIKFRADRPPRIHVASEHRDGEWRFSVRDNGIGIPAEHARRIFVIFQRLHPRDRYPGTGIGLTVCQKIVSRHGGRIWVESEPGQGSTFYFTLPHTETAPARA